MYLNSAWFKKSCGDERPKRDELPASADKTIRVAYEKYLLPYERKHGTDAFSLASAAPIVGGGGAGASAGAAADAGDVADADATAFEFGIGMQAKCLYKDGKRYNVTVVERKLVPAAEATKVAAERSADGVAPADGIPAT